MGKLVVGLVVGLFYGAFGLWCYQKAAVRKRSDRLVAQALDRLAEDIWGEGCTCDECCDCGSTAAVDDRASYWPKGHIEA